MWQTYWSIPSDPLPATTRHESTLPLDAVESTSVLLWEEHCLECAVPECYQVCPLYAKRMDEGCARFENGIDANPAFSGLYPYGAEIKFRRWGKLESAISARSAQPANLRRLDRLDQLTIRSVRSAARMGRLGPLYKYDDLRKWLLRVGAPRTSPHFDDFVLEVWNQQILPVRLVLECVQNGPRFRASFLIKPGHNLYTVPVDSMNIDFGVAGGFIRTYPENDACAHLVFTWLDFVAYSAHHHSLHRPAVA